MSLISDGDKKTLEIIANDISSQLKHEPLSRVVLNYTWKESDSLFQLASKHPSTFTAMLDQYLRVPILSGHKLICNRQEDGTYNLVYEFTGRDSIPAVISEVENDLIQTRIRDLLSDVAASRNLTYKQSSELTEKHTAGLDRRLRREFFRRYISLLTSQAEDRPPN